MKLITFQNQTISTNHRIYFLIFAIISGCFNLLQAQEPCNLRTEIFSSYSTSSPIGPQASRWTTWSGNEGGEEDAYVINDNGNKILYITNDGVQDVVYKLGNKNNGKYEVRFSMYASQVGYFNIQNDNASFVGSGAFEVYFKSNGYADIKRQGSTLYSLYVGTNRWVNIKLTADFNTGNHVLRIDNTNINLPSSIGLTKLGGINFYAITGANYYVDNIYLDHIDCNDDGGDNGGENPVSNIDLCGTATTITCGQTTTYTNATGTSNMSYNNYSNCLDPNVSSSANPFTGKERVFKVYVPNTTTLRVDMTNLSTDLDLFLFQDCMTLIVDDWNNPYQITLPNNCVRSGASPGTTNEFVELNNAQGYYYIVVDGYNTSQVGNFTLSVNCQNCPANLVDSNCNLIDFEYKGTSSSPLRYKFNVNKPYGATNGTWTYQRQGYSTTYTIGTNTSITKDFGTASGTYDVCYNYTLNGCEYECCIPIYIGNPANCPIINTVYNASNDQIALDVAGINNNNIIEWVNDSTGENLAASTSAIAIPNPPTCQIISVSYFDVVSQTYRVCCVEVCSQCPTSVDNDCNLISYQYTGTNGSLRYTFSVPNTSPSGAWTYQENGGNTYNLGISKTVSRTFNWEGSYTLCYNYSVNNCDIECCKTIYINNPLSCNAILQNYNSVSNTFELEIPNVNNNQVTQWIDDTNGNTLETAQAAIAIPAPTPGVCVPVSVYFFDPNTGTYRVCCTEICTPQQPQSESCCNQDICSNSFLLDLVTELNTFCGAYYSNSVLNKGEYQGEIVYFEPPENRSIADMPGRVYNCQGDVIFEYGGFTIPSNSNMNLFNQITNITTIFECGDVIPCLPSNPTCCPDAVVDQWLPSVIELVAVMSWGTPEVTCLTFNNERIIEIKTINCNGDDTYYIYTCDGTIIPSYGNPVIGGTDPVEYFSTSGLSEKEEALIDIFEEKESPDTSINQDVETESKIVTPTNNSKITLTNYPNPFTAYTSINWTLDQATTCEFQLTDIQGQEIAKWTYDGVAGQNSYQLAVPENTPTGTYFLNMTTNHSSKMIKLSYLK